MTADGPLASAYYAWETCMEAGRCPEFDGKFVWSTHVCLLSDVV